MKFDMLSPLMAEMLSKADANDALVARAVDEAARHIAP